MSNAEMAKPSISEEQKESVGKIHLSSLPTLIPKDEIKSEWHQSLSDARANVSLCTPMLSYMMFSCKFVWTHEVPTAGALPYNKTNYIFINPTFWMTRLRNREERAFVILHEVKHIFLEHCGRQVDNGYNHELWNIAADYNINITCSGVYKDNNGNVHQNDRYKSYVSRPKFCLYDERFINMSSDEIYHLLVEENNGSAEEAVKKHGGGERPGEGDNDGQMPLDDVATASPGAVQKMDNRQTASAAVAQADASNSIGDSEGNLVKTLRDLATPKVNWKDELANAIMSSTKERPTYNRLSRRSSGDVAFPSLTGFKIKGVYGFDSSGSMGQNDYKDVAGELMGLLEQFEAWELDLVSCDRTAHVIGHYSSDEGDDFSSIDLQAKGLGGTVMQSMHDYARELAEEEDIAFNIILTDGYLMDSDLQDIDDSMVTIAVVTREGNSSYTNENLRVIHMKNMG